MAEKLRITNNTGLGAGTKIMLGDVDLADKVTGIQFDPIVPNKPIVVHLQMMVDELDVIAEQSTNDDEVK